MKSVKKILFFSLFSILFFTLVSSQVTCPSPDDVILKLSSPTNAHGETWDQNNYNTQICFGSLFPGYTIPSNPHDCKISAPGATPTNLVLRLSDGSKTNSHAQAPGQTPPYTTDVCYGDLVCQKVSGNQNCPTNFLEVVSLSANSNAHLETASANQYTQASNAKICCQASNVPQIFDAKWRYFDENEIPVEINICPNALIYASVRTTGLANGEEVIFQIRNNNGVAIPSQNLFSAITAQVSNNQANVSLNLSDPAVKTILNAAVDGIDNDVELEFTAHATNIPGTTLTSYVINYVNNISLCSYSEPHPIIEAPKHRAVYFVNTIVNLTSSCTSPLGPVTNEWKLTQNGNTIDLNGNQLEHTFASAGQVNIRLKCTDSIGNSNVNETQILIASTDQTLAYINKPSFNDVVYSSPVSGVAYFPESVEFSASDSFAVNVNICTVNCLGGNCPQKTENSPLNCGGGPLNIIQTGSVTYNTLNFNWTFLDDNWVNETGFDGVGSYAGTIQYDDLSNNINDKKIKTTVTHLTSGATATFERDFTLGRCLNNGNLYYSGDESLSTNQENSACTGGDTIAATADDCCANGLICMPGTSNPNRYSCQIPPSGSITQCEDFTNEDNCEDNTNPSIPRASYGGSPPSCTFLECFWDEDDNSCGVQATKYPQTAGGSCNVGSGGTGFESQCAWTTSTSECKLGRKTITYTTTLGGSVCDKPALEVPCGSRSFELSLFGIRQFMLALLLIASIYFLLNIKNDK